MARAPKSNMVTRRVVASRTFDVYEVVKGELTKLGQETIVGRAKESEIATKYNVKKVVLIEVACLKKTYGVPIEQFMDIAVEVINEDSDDTEIEEVTE